MCGSRRVASAASSTTRRGARVPAGPHSVAPAFAQLLVVQLPSLSLCCLCLWRLLFSPSSSSPSFHPVLQRSAASHFLRHLSLTSLAFPSLASVFSLCTSPPSSSRPCVLVHMCVRGFVFASVSACIRLNRAMYWRVLMAIHSSSRSRLHSSTSQRSYSQSSRSRLRRSSSPHPSLHCQSSSCSLTRPDLCFPNTTWAKDSANCVRMSVTYVVLNGNIVCVRGGIMMRPMSCAGNSRPCQWSPDPGETIVYGEKNRRRTKTQGSHSSRVSWTELDVFPRDRFPGAGVRQWRWPRYRRSTMGFSNSGTPGGSEPECELALALD